MSLDDVSDAALVEMADAFQLCDRRKETFVVVHYGSEIVERCEVEAEIDRRVCRWVKVKV